MQRFLYYYLLRKFVRLCIFRQGQFFSQLTCTNLLFVSCYVVTLYHSPAHLLCLLHLSFVALHQLWRLPKLKQGQVALQFLLPNVVIATDAMQSHWPFYLQGSGSPLLCKT